MRPFLTLGIAVLATASLAGCRGPFARQQTEPAATVAARAATPSATAPSTLQADVLALLRRYAFTQSNLPSGYGVGGLVEVPNQQAATDYADPRAAQQEIADTGRQGGLGQQVFPPSSVSGTIGLSIEAFKDPGGAQHWAAHPPPLPSALKPSPIDPERTFGDASSATHWTQGAQSGFVLSFSQGRIVYGLGIAAPSGQESLAPLQSLAQALEQIALQQSN